jgi:hypothetical protein
VAWLYTYQGVQLAWLFTDNSVQGGLTLNWPGCAGWSGSILIRMCSWPGSLLTMVCRVAWLYTDKDVQAGLAKY